MPIDVCCGMTPNLLFIHGFDSSPASYKANLTREYVQRHCPGLEFIAPQIPNDPSQAVALLQQIIEDRKGELALLGSSLGGFYALHMAQRYDLRAVLVNPAVEPHRLIQPMLGWHTHSYTGEYFELTQAHADTLAAMQVSLQAHEYQNFMLLLQSGDETLDFLQASARFPAMRAVIEYGGDHTFTGFERWMPEITKFLRLKGCDQFKI